MDNTDNHQFKFVKVTYIHVEIKYLHTWDSTAMLLLTRSVVVIATAAESALHMRWSSSRMF